LLDLTCGDAIYGSTEDGCFYDVAYLGLCVDIAGAAEIAGRLTNSAGNGLAGVVVTVYGQQQEAIQGTHRLTPLRFVCCHGDCL